MKRTIMCAVMALTLCLVCGHVSAEIEYDEIFFSTNLQEFMLTAECNPGGGTDCACSPHDVAIQSFDDYAEVTSNPDGRNVWVNAIGGIPYFEYLPNGSLIRPGRYKYGGELRLPAIPFPNPRQYENANGVHMVLTLWDGRKEFYVSDKISMEAGVYWELNPWHPDFGKIKIYEGNLELNDTGVYLRPDTKWHSIEFEVDFNTLTWISLKVDGQHVDLKDRDLAFVHRPYWGENLGLIITAESLSTWPFADCSAGAYTWTTQFRNILLQMSE